MTFTTPGPARPVPAMSDDTRFFWDGAKRRELLIQRCTSCSTLRHPPGPGCASCGSLDWDTVQASGRGTLHTYAVAHHPQLPGFDYPLIVGLVDLEEGTRVLSNVVDISPDDIEIGMAVEVEFRDFENDLTLPVFRPGAPRADQDAPR